MAQCRHDEIERLKKDISILMDVSLTFKGDDLLEEKGEKRQEEIIMEKLGL